MTGQAYGAGLITYSTPSTSPFHSMPLSEVGKVGMEHSFLSTLMPVLYPLKQHCVPLVTGGVAYPKLREKGHLTLGDEGDSDPPDSLLGLLWLPHLTSRPHLGFVSLSL